MPGGNKELVGVATVLIRKKKKKKIKNASL